MSTVGRPGWFEQLREACAGAGAGDLSRYVPPEDHHRRSAVLMLFGEEAGRGPDVLLTQRAATLRSHPGQVSFPGGRIDPGDAGPVEAALREAHEETGLVPEGVQPALVLPEIFIPVSNFAVTPVLAWWHRPSPVGAADPAEVARAARIPVADLVDPDNRFCVELRGGYRGPGFEADGLFIWGFTAGLLDRLVHLAGWERPWNRERVRSVPPGFGVPSREGRTTP